MTESLRFWIWFIQCFNSNFFYDEQLIIFIDEHYQNQNYISTYITFLLVLKSIFFQHRVRENLVALIRLIYERKRCRLVSLINRPRVRSHAAVDDCDDEDTSTGSGSSDSGRWNPHSEGGVVRGTTGKPHVTVLGSRSTKRRSRGRRDPATAGGKSAPASFRSRDVTAAVAAEATTTTGSATGTATSGPGTRTIANGLKMAQNQAIAVAGFLADVDSRQWRVCASCLSHRASYHGRGD